MKMQPISRATLRNARAVAEEEKRQQSIREEETRGQIAAEAIYHEVCFQAKKGNVTPYFIVGGPVALAHAVALLKVWFPDSDIFTEYQSVRISWE